MYDVLCEAPIFALQNSQKKQKHILRGVTISYVFGNKESRVYTEMEW